jgi:hypothetical protein
MEHIINNYAGRPAMSAAMSTTPSPFLATMIAFLEPYFAAAGIDLAAARMEIVETLASYGTRSRAEIIQSAKIMAFSMCAMETLKEGMAPDMSLSMRLRYRSCANGLDRSSRQNEKALAARLARDLPGAREPSNDMPDAAAHEAAQEAQAAIDGFRNRLMGRSPQPMGVYAEPVSKGPASKERELKVPGPTMPGSPTRELPMPEFQWPAVKASPEEAERTKTMWGDAMIKVLGDMGRPVQPVAASA